MSSITNFYNAHKVESWVVIAVVAYFVYTKFIK